MGGDLIKGYGKGLCKVGGLLQFHTTSHPSPKIPTLIPPYPSLFLLISLYPHLISTILSISTAFSIFRHIPQLQINYYVHSTKA